MNSIYILIRIVKLFFLVLQYIWKFRNEILFVIRNIYLMEDIFIVVEINNKWILFYVSIRLKLGNVIKFFIWEIFFLECFKYNFDCSFRKEIGIVGVRLIVRNENGLFMCVGMVRIYNVLFVL